MTICISVIKNMGKNRDMESSRKMGRIYMKVNLLKETRMVKDLDMIKLEIKLGWKWKKEKGLISIMIIPKELVQMHLRRKLG